MLGKRRRDSLARPSERRAVSDPSRAIEAWTRALSSPEQTDGLAELIGENVTTTSALGTVEGKEAVLASFGRSPVAAFFGQGTWSDVAVDGPTATTTCKFPAGAPVGGVTVKVTVDDSGLITRVDSTVVPAPPPVAKPVALLPLRDAINGALMNATPMTVAYVDREGQPHLSLRGTVQVHSDEQLAMWIRNPEGGLLDAIKSNPHLALMYRDTKTRTNYQFRGRAHAETGDDVRETVYANSPEPERNLDPQKRGVPVLVDVDRVEGRDASGIVLMSRDA